MERMTYRDRDGMAMMKDRGGWKHGGIDRLAAYEETGLGPDEIKEFAEDVARQFAYQIKTIDGHAAYSTGGLSTLEWAFQILGWDEPHPCPECECQAEGCNEWATCGTPTKDGYKWLCYKHCKGVQGGTV